MLVLASSSPRRRELLTRLGLDFVVKVPNVEERFEGGSPERIVTELAVKKSRAVECGKDDIIISADTLVWLDGPLGKPRDDEEARRMLRRLSGRWHTVYTGVCVRTVGWEEVFCEATRVKFREISDLEIECYLATGEHRDKAGAYGIQGFASTFVERIEGDYTNVVGLPLPRLWSVLIDRGIVCRNGLELRSARKVDE